MNSLFWFGFLESFQTDKVYIEVFATAELAFKRSTLFRSFVADFKKHVNNPRYDKYFQLLQHLELKLVGNKLYFIYHTDTVNIHTTKFAKTNIRLQKLGFPRIQNA